MKITLQNKILSKDGKTSYLVFDRQNFQYQTGQFVMLDNGKIKRAYSIASTPNDKNLVFYVKKASENGLSKYLTEDIQVGDSLELTGPYGHMILEDSKKYNYLLISIGSGLAPIYSIYNYLNETGNFNKIVNIYGERYRASIVDNILKNFEKYTSNSVKNYVYLSREDIKGFKKGYVQNSLNEAIDFLGKETTKVYICGKPAMVDDVVEKLLYLGIDKGNMYFEKF